MAVTALVLWLLTALGGAVLLVRFVGHGGGAQQRSGETRLGAPLVFGHPLLAVLGLLVWIGYLLLDRPVLAWTALALLVAVALLGFAMFARWLPAYRGRSAPSGGGRRAAGGPAGTGTGPAEAHLPVPVVAGHGLLAVVTLLLVLWVALTG